MPEEQLLGAIEEAVGVSLLEEHTQGRDVRYRFTHAYFRQTLYGEMIAPRRLRLHNEVAKALEQHYGARLDEHAAELAEHFAHSSTEEDLRKAVHYGELAAQRAAGVYAHGEAARLLEQALQVQDVLDPNDGAKRYDLMDGLANALLSAGEPKRVSDEIAPEMFAIAERLGDDTGDMAGAACWLAQEALARQDAGPVFATPEWAMWTERLYQHSAVRHSLSSHRGSERGMDALRIPSPVGVLGSDCRCAGRRPVQVGHTETFATAMFAFLTSGAPPELERARAQVAEEFATLPRAGIRPGSLASAVFNQMVVFLAVGDLPRANAARKELEDFSRRVGDPCAQTFQMVAEVWRLGMAGELRGRRGRSPRVR